MEAPEIQTKAIPHTTADLSRLRLSTSRLSLAVSSTAQSDESSISSPRKKSFSIPIPFRRSVESFLIRWKPVLRYLWPKNNIKLRVYLFLSIAFLFTGKAITVKVPFLLQRAVDSLSRAGSGTIEAASALDCAVKMIFYYGLARGLAVACSEVKTSLFAYVCQSMLRSFAGQIFSKLHALDSVFHLQRPSGTISVAYVRAVRGLQTLLLQLCFHVFPAIIELFLVSHLLRNRFGRSFQLVTFATFATYILFTVAVTEWRTKLRQDIVEVDNKRNGFFIDSLLNHEVVKLFTNEDSELRQFDGYLKDLERLNIQMTISIAALNFGQAVLFCTGLTSSLLLGINGVVSGRMSVGDLVAVNMVLMQLAVPFNSIGYTYQECRQSLVDMNYMRAVLEEATENDSDSSSTDCELPSIDVVAPLDRGHKKHAASSVEFRDVCFSYRENSTATAEPLIQGANFFIHPGESVAIVGPSGSGKSTILRLITRMMDPESGSVLIDGVDSKTVSIKSLRKRISVVPQDTILFDNTILYNLLYGRANATAEQIQEVISRCNLNGTIEKLKLGLQTEVGERGARLSGGERQKISIARALLRDPSLILCDEPTSAVDAFSERELVETLRTATSEGSTTITVAHRLSTIKHCDRIIVMDRGVVVEQGSHRHLMESSDVVGLYRQMWNLQNANSTVPFDQPQGIIASPIASINANSNSSVRSISIGSLSSSKGGNGAPSFLSNNNAINKSLTSLINEERERWWERAKAVGIGRSFLANMRRSGMGTSPNSVNGENRDRIDMYTLNKLIIREASEAFLASSLDPGTAGMLDNRVRASDSLECAALRRGLEVSSDEASELDWRARAKSDGKKSNKTRTAVRMVAVDSDDHSISNRTNDNTEN